jgi:hypothetical protein
VQAGLAEGGARVLRVQVAEDATLSSGWEADS